jgi:hypothetical protein
MSSSSGLANEAAMIARFPQSDGGRNRKDVASESSKERKDAASRGRVVRGCDEPARQTANRVGWARRPFSSRRSRTAPRASSIWDNRVSKRFKTWGNQSAEGLFDLFNTLNVNTITAQTNRNGSTYQQPTTIIAPRVFRLGVRYKF